MRKTKESALHWIWKTTGKIKTGVFALLIVQVLQSAAVVASAWILKQVINTAVDHNREGFFLSAGIFVGATVFQLITAAFNRYLQELTKSKTENRFKSVLFSCLLKKKFDDITAVHSGEWMNRLTNDTVVIAEGVTVIVPEVCGMIVKLLGAVVSLIVLIPKLSVLLVPAGIIMVILTYIFRKKLKKLHKDIQESDGRLRIFMSERLASLMMVKIFGKEDSTVDQADEKMADHKDARMRRNHFSNICNIGFGLMMKGAYALGAVYCGYGILTGTVSYGTFTAALQLISQIQSPFANITGYLPKYYAMTASAERIMEAVAIADDITQEPMSHEKAERFYADEFRAIVLEDICFDYRSHSEPDREMPPVLRNVNAEICRGDYVAFTGHSGCGKSTALKLIASLYKEDSGRKYISAKSGDIDLTAEMRSLFSYVPQGNQLMSGTIREIVSFFDSELMKDDERIKNALKIACAYDFVSELTDDIDTRLGERGAGLSEGQMQRIAIARAVFAGNPVMLLDEATSSLDEKTERMILENLKNMTDRTVIIVTHRPAALEICNKRVVFGEE